MSDPACSTAYLRKRFSERIWDSPLMVDALAKVDLPEALDPLVDALVEGLLIEMGAE